MKKIHYSKVKVVGSELYDQHFSRETYGAQDFGVETLKLLSVKSESCVLICLQSLRACSHGPGATH